MSSAAMGLQERLDSSEAKARLAMVAPDQAVLHPEHDRAVSAELRQEALQVREALDALEAGDLGSALNPLRDVARGSPFSDWKLSRGLAANYQYEAEETRADWDRFDSRRAAWNSSASSRPTAPPNGSPPSARPTTSSAIPDADSRRNCSTPLPTTSSTRSTSTCAPSSDSARFPPASCSHWPNYYDNQYKDNL